MTRPNLAEMVSRLHDAGIPPRLGPDLGLLLRPMTALWHESFRKVSRFGAVPSHDMGARRIRNSW